MGGRCDFCGDITEITGYIMTAGFWFGLTNGGTSRDWRMRRTENPVYISLSSSALSSISGNICIFSAGVAAAAVGPSSG